MLRMASKDCGGGTSLSAGVLSGHAYHMDKHTSRHGQKSPPTELQDFHGKDPGFRGEVPAITSPKPISKCTDTRVANNPRVLRDQFTINQHRFVS